MTATPSVTPTPIVAPTPTPTTTPNPNATPEPEATPTPAPATPLPPAATPQLIPTPEPGGPLTEPDGGDGSSPLEPDFEFVLFGSRPQLAGTRTLRFTCRASSSMSKRMCRAAITPGRKSTAKPLVVKRARFSGRTAKFALVLPRSAMRSVRKTGVTVRLSLLGADNVTKVAQATQYYRPAARR